MQHNAVTLKGQIGTDENEVSFENKTQKTNQTEEIRNKVLILIATIHFRDNLIMFLCENPIFTAKSCSITQLKLVCCVMTREP